MTPTQRKVMACHLHDAEVAGDGLDCEIAALTRRRDWIRRECVKMRAELDAES